MITSHEKPGRPKGNAKRSARHPWALGRRALLTAATGVLFGLCGLARRAFAETGTQADAEWGELARALDGRLLRLDSPDFTRLAAPWNLRFAPILPAGIARCESTDDVRMALLWAEANNVPLAIRAGGHSYAGFSTTAGLMIDVSPMNQVAYDEASGQARLGGGARNRDVSAALAPLGRGMAHGRCKGVGIAGLVLGGGIGFGQRLSGLACDQLIETEIVTASGELLRCNAEENADLFWACRGGGGGNFGVNTSFTFTTQAVDTVTVFRLVWTSRLRDILPALLNYLPAMPHRFGCKFIVDAGQTERLELLGQLVGTEGEATALLAPFLRISHPAQKDVRTLAYWEGQDFLAEDDTPEYVHERSRFIYRTVSAEGARTILDHLRRFPGTHAGADWKVFLTGGAVATVPPDATAFVHRRALMLSSIELNWTADDDAAALARNESWLAEFHAAMQPYASAECYQNFIDPAETNYLRAYYGTNLERLVEIKRRYDPRNVFRFAQSIPLSL